MELSDYRAQIDRIDAELLRLFAERMQTAAGIAAYKNRTACRFWTLGGNARSWRRS